VAKQPFPLRDFAGQRGARFWANTTRQRHAVFSTSSADHQHPFSRAASLGNNRRADQPKAYGRSKVTNGNALFPENTTLSWARRLRDIIALHTADLGGADSVSSLESSIIRRAATETVELELIEQRFAKNGKVHLQKTSICMPVFRIRYVGIWKRLDSSVSPKISRRQRWTSLARQFEAEEAANARDAADNDGAVE